MRNIIKKNLIKHYSIDMDNLDFISYKSLHNNSKIIITGIELDPYTLSIIIPNEVTIEHYLRFCSFVSDVKKDMEEE